MFLKQIGPRFLTILLCVLLCNVPQYLAAQVAAAPQGRQSAQEQNSPSTDSNAQQNPPATNSQGGSKYDPAQAPLAPVPNARPSQTSTVPPDAPSEVQRTQQAQSTQTAPQQKPVQ